MRTIPALAVAAMLATSARPTSAALQIHLGAPSPTAGPGFIKFGDIKGDATEVRHKDWIEIESYSWGTSSAAPLSSGTLTITKSLDKATPLLAQRCSSKKAVPQIMVDLPPLQTEQGLAQYVLRDVTITACVQSNGRESLAFHYMKIEMKK